MANSIHIDNSQGQQRLKALKALEIAKQLERENLKNGKKYQKINYKTWVLQK